MKTRLFFLLSWMFVLPGLVACGEGGQRPSAVADARSDARSGASQDPDHGSDHDHDHDDYAHDDHAHDEDDHDHADVDSVEIAADMAEAHGLKTAPVGAGRVSERLLLYGSIQPNAEQRRQVRARFPGVVERVSVQVGDTVRAGQVLARVESNESLQVYAVTAPIAGTVTVRAINPGESTDGQALFEIADFSTVWAELSVFPRDRAQLRTGQTVEVGSTDGAVAGQGRLVHLSPLGAANQALVARVELDNADARWMPGQFVSARVWVGEAQAAVVVPLAAVQVLEEREVVFVAEGDRYRAQPVTLGRRDDRQVEVTAGLEAGARVVVAQSFLVKADIGKSGAGHNH